MNDIIRIRAAAINLDSVNDQRRLPQHRAQNRRQQRSQDGLLDSSIGIEALRLRGLRDHRIDVHLERVLQDGLNQIHVTLGAYMARESSSKEYFVNVGTIVHLDELARVR